MQFPSSPTNVELVGIHDVAVLISALKVSVFIPEGLFQLRPHEYDATDRASQVRPADESLQSIKTKLIWVEVDIMEERRIESLLASKTTARQAECHAGRLRIA